MEGISSSNLQPAVPDLAESCALNEQKEDKNEGGLERSTNNPALDIKGNTANTRYASQVDVRKNAEESWKQPRDNNDLSATSEDMMVDSDTSAANQNEEAIKSGSAAQTPVRYCKVCDSPQAAGMYFGVLACIPCKAFFIRCLTDIENGISMVCVSRNKPDQCEITLETRTICKACRFQKCLQQGMARKERPASISNEDGHQLCTVCHDIANGIHFGAVTCEGCKKFYRRAMNEAQSYTCKHQGQCDITARTRNSCRFCRWQKCIKVGMSKQAIRMGRPSKFAQLQLPYKDPVIPAKASKENSSNPDQPGIPLSEPISKNSDWKKDSTLDQSTPTSSSSVKPSIDISDRQKLPLDIRHSEKPSGFHSSRSRDHSADRASKHSTDLPQSRDSSCEKTKLKHPGIHIERSKDRSHMFSDATFPSPTYSYEIQCSSSHDYISSKNTGFRGDTSGPDYLADNLPKRPSFQKESNYNESHTASRPAALQNISNKSQPEMTRPSVGERDNNKSLDIVLKDNNASKQHQDFRISEVMNIHKSHSHMESAQNFTMPSKEGSLPSQGFRMPFDLVHETNIRQPLAQNPNDPMTSVIDAPDKSAYSQKKAKGYELTRPIANPTFQPNVQSSSVPRFSRSLSDPKSVVTGSLKKRNFPEIRQLWLSGGLNRSLSMEEQTKPSNRLARSGHDLGSCGAEMGLPSLSLSSETVNEDLFGTVIKEEVTSNFQYSEICETESEANISPTELISGESNLDGDMFVNERDNLQDIPGFTDTSMVKTEPENDTGYGKTYLGSAVDTLDMTSRKRKIIQKSESPTEERLNVLPSKDGGSVLLSNYGNGSTARKQKNFDGYHDDGLSSASQNSNFNKQFVSAFLNLIRVMQDLPPSTNINQMNARGLLSNLCPKPQETAQGQPSDEGQFSRSQLQEIHQALSSLIPVSSDNNITASSANAVISSANSYSSSQPSRNMDSVKGFESSQGQTASNKSFTQWRSPTTRLPNHPRMSRPFAASEYDCHSRPMKNQHSFTITAPSSGNMSSRIRAPFYSHAAEHASLASGTQGSKLSANSLFDPPPPQGMNQIEGSTPHRSDSHNTGYYTSPLYEHNPTTGASRDGSSSSKLDISCQAEQSNTAYQKQESTLAGYPVNVSQRYFSDGQSTSTSNSSPFGQDQTPEAANPEEEMSIVIQTMMENLTAGFKTNKMELATSTTPSSNDLPSVAGNFTNSPPVQFESFPVSSPSSQPVPSGDTENLPEEDQPAVDLSVDLPPWEPPRVDYDYWLNPKLPNPNIFLTEAHNEYIHTLLSAYKDFIEDMEGTLLFLQAETKKFLKKYGEMVPPLEILRKELALFAQSTVSFCCRIPDFSSLCKEDQMVLYRVGGNQSRILTSAVHWFDKDTHEYTIFYPLKPHPGRMDYQFYLGGKQFCQRVQENLEIDLVEESLLQAALYYATDYQGLKDTKLISKLRWRTLECFRAYTTAKYGSSNTKIEDLFAVMPQLRQLGLLEHQLGQNLSLLKDQSYPVPDPMAVKNDFPLPDIVHEAIMKPKGPPQGESENR